MKGTVTMMGKTDERLFELPDDGVFEHYFAAANTSHGFKSYFGEIFSPLKFEHIYILKGGPGVGKSTLMKKVAVKAGELGLSPTLYHCSSDPYSLDGVVIEKLGTAILDGTSPHTVDPTAAGVRETIVNMGECWDTGKLYESGRRIIELIKEKSACYGAAYDYLGAEKQIRDSLWEQNKRTLLCDKLYADVRRVSDRIFKKRSDGKQFVRITRAVSCAGEVRFTTFEQQCEVNYFLRDVRGTAFEYLSAIRKAAAEKGIDTLVSFDPADPAKADALCFPKLSVSFSLYNDDYCKSLEKLSKPYKVINMSRFSDPKAYALVREKYRFGEKCACEMRSAALDYLRRAGEIHAETEKLYGKATDYHGVARLTEKVIAGIF